MRTKIIGMMIGVAMILPVSASAMVLSVEAQQQLNVLVVQLIQIMTQLSQAQAQGPAYANSPAFQQMAVSIATQLSQIQSQLIPILVSANAQNEPRYTPAQNPTYGNIPLAACTRFGRDMQPGTQGQDVYALQQYLATDIGASFLGAPHGIYDNETLLAVQRFQAARGIVAYGTWDTTGFGRVGPATRAALYSACMTQQQAPRAPIVTAVPPSFPTPFTVNSTQMENSSTGSFVANYGGNAVDNAIQFVVTAQPNATCSTNQFTLSFGDGAEQILVFAAACNQQTQTVRHVYPQRGTYSARLRSGSFEIGQQIDVPMSSSGGATLTMSAAKGSTSYSVVLSATSTAATSCSASSYIVSFGDGEKFTLDFPATCGVRTRTISHTYPESNSYVITVSDTVGVVTSFAFQSSIVAAAGAGDPYVTTFLHGEGVDGSTAIVDSSIVPHTWTAYGNTQIDTANFAGGSGSIYFDGSGDYAATGPSGDFNFGTNAFTVDFWFSPAEFPGINGQAALLQQANAGGNDSSFGGAGLELFGDKLYFVGTFGSATYHPYYNNSIHTDSLELNRWYHVAIVRSGNIVSMYLNGVKKGTLTVSGAANASSNSLTLGRFGDLDGNYFKGWIDDVRIAKGTARWSADFDPNTVLPEAAGKIGSASGSNYGYDLLVHADGAQGSVYFPDSALTPHVVTSFGGAYINASLPYAGTGSVDVRATGAFLSTPDSADLELRDRNFAVQIAARPINARNGDIYSKFGSFQIRRQGSAWQLISSGTSLPSVYTFGTVSTNAWNDIKIERNAGTITFTVNGAVVATQPITGSFTDNANSLVIGSDFASGSVDLYGGQLAGFSGYLDEIALIVH